MAVVPGSSDTTVQLLKCEQRQYLDEIGITTVTFFKGDPASGAAAVKARLAEVLRANAWLAARLACGEWNMCAAWHTVSGTCVCWPAMRAFGIVQLHNLRCAGVRTS